MPGIRVAVLAPMRSELRPLVRRLDLAPAREARSRSRSFLQGALGSVDVIAARTGVGMRRAADRTREVLELAAPDHLLVVGIAGGIGPSVGVGDLVVPELVSDLATGEAFRPVPLGAHPPRGTLVSSDVLLESPSEAQRLASLGAVAIDMESAAVARVCAARGCPFSVFRAVSDRADDATTDAAILALIDAQGDPRPGAVARLLLAQPHRIPLLVRLARGARRATRTAADAALAGLASLDVSSR